MLYSGEISPTRKHETEQQDSDYHNSTTIGLFTTDTSDKKFTT